MLSENVENYLKSIFALQTHLGRVTTSALSERLQVSAPSVSEMLRKLADDECVIYTPYKGVELTEKGYRRALRIIRRHRLWELFLVQVLKYEWDEIHEEAERLEHMTSEKLEKRLDATLGYPQIDPHGDIIPSAEGVLETSSESSLAEIEPMATVVISRVSDANPEILKYASRLGMALCQEMRVKEKILFDGSIRVEIGGKEQFISAKLAENIFVETVS